MSLPLNPVPELVKKAFGLAGRGLLKGTIGTGPTRMALGTGIGALYGAASSEEGSQMGYLGSIAGGAAMGLGLGFATTGTALRGVIGAGKTIAKKTPGLAYGLGKKAASIGGGVGRFALNRPKTAAMIGLGGFSAYGLVNSGYGETSASNEAMIAMAEQRGMPSTEMGDNIDYLNNGPGVSVNPLQMSRAGRAYSNFTGSTNGLVQGLHHRRHT